MRRPIAQWAWFVLLCIAIHSAQAGDSSQPANFVDIDDLLVDYAEYKGEVVRLNACLAVSHHGMMLGSCEGGKQFISFDPIGSASESEVEKIIQAGSRIRRREISNVKVCLEGVFDYEAGSYPIFHLYVIKILDLSEEMRNPD